jgi:hypothetical protein
MLTQEDKDRRGFCSGNGIAGLARALVVMAVIYTVALMVRESPGFRLFIDGLLALLSVWLPAAVCWITVHRLRQGRADIVLATSGVTSWAAGAMSP